MLLTLGVTLALLKPEGQVLFLGYMEGPVKAVLQNSDLRVLILENDPARRKAAERLRKDETVQNRVAVLRDHLQVPSELVSTDTELGQLTGHSGTRENPIDEELSAQFVACSSSDRLLDFLQAAECLSPDSPIFFLTDGGPEVVAQALGTLGRWGYSVKKLRGGELLFHPLWAARKLDIAELFLSMPPEIFKPSERFAAKDFLDQALRFVSDGPSGGPEVPGDTRLQKLAQTLLHESVVLRNGVIERDSLERRLAVLLGEQAAEIIAAMELTVSHFAQVPSPSAALASAPGLVQNIASESTAWTEHNVVDASYKDRLAFLLMAETPAGTRACFESWLDTRSDDFEWVVVIVLLSPDPALRDAVASFAGYEAHFIEAQSLGPVEAFIAGIRVVESYCPVRAFLARDSIRFVRIGWDHHINDTGFRYGMEAAFVSGQEPDAPLIHGSADPALGSPAFVGYTPDRIMMPEQRDFAAVDLSSAVWEWAHRLRRRGQTWVDPGRDLRDLAGFLKVDNPGLSLRITVRLKAHLVLLVQAQNEAKAALSSWKATRSPDIDWSLSLIPFRDEPATSEAVRSLISDGVDKIVAADVSSAEHIQDAIHAVEGGPYAFGMIASDSVRFTRNGWDEHLMKTGFEWNLGAIFVSQTNDVEEAKLVVTGQFQYEEQLPLLVAFDPTKTRGSVAIEIQKEQTSEHYFKHWVSTLAQFGLTWRTPGDDLSRLVSWLALGERRASD